jgi:glycosyltransferase involved in cell wall biosynthesis
MQIEVQDDCSVKEDPAAVVSRVGKGRITFFKHPKRGGQSANFSSCIQRSRGEWVHIFQDDDVLLPGFYQAYEAFIKEHPDVAMIFCRCIQIDENGQWLSILNPPPNWSGAYWGVLDEEKCRSDLAATNFIVATTVAVRRDIYERMGGYDEEIPFSSDWEMWSRIAEIGKVGYIHQPLCCYRSHINSATSTQGPKRKTFFEIVNRLPIRLDRVPAHLRSEALKQARIHISEYCNHSRAESQLRKQHREAFYYTFKAIQYSPTVENFLRIPQTLLRWALWR